MGNITSFDAGNVKLNPTETGVEATARTAQRVGAFYSQRAGAEQMLANETERLGSQTERLGSEVGASFNAIGHEAGSSIETAGNVAVKYLEHQDISRGAAGFANLTQKATDDWNAIVKNADPNDPTVATKYRESLEANLDQFKNDGFLTEGGQKWAEAHVDALRQHMMEKTSADMSSLAGQAAVVNTQQTINSLSATVHSDPTSLDFSLAALKSSTEGIISSSPNLTGPQAGQVRSEILQKGAESIIKSAAIGYIEKNAAMPPWATDPKYAKYVNGAELQMLEKAAKVQARSDLLIQKQAQLYDKMVADQKVHAGTNKIIADNVSIDPTTNRPVIKPDFFKQALDLAKANPDAPSASTTVRTLFDWGEHQQDRKEVVQSDPAVKADLATRMFDPNKPTTAIDIMRAETQGKLSHTDAAIMRGNVTALEESPLKGPVYAETMKAVHDQLVVNVPGLPGKDTIGTSNYAAFIQNFIPKYLAKSRDGTLPSNALDVKDPNSMISQEMAPFKRSAAQRMSDYVTVAGGLPGSTPAPPPRNDAMPAIPAPDQRQAGSIYDTPKGKMKWTGTGWVAP